MSLAPGPTSEPRQEAAGLRNQVLARLQDFPPAQRRLADYLLANIAYASDLTITELSHASGVSIGTISQFCRLLGLRGYQDLRLGWARAAVIAASLDGNRPARLDVSDRGDNPISDAIARVFESDARALVETADQLDRQAMTEAVTLLEAARHVEWLGVATSGLVAAEGALKLRKLGIEASAHPDTHQQAMSAALLSPSDVVVAVSHSGQAVDVIRCVEIARGVGAKVIAITRAARSPLATLANVVLATVSYDTAFQIEPMASTVVEMAMIQVLFLVLLERGGADAQAALERTQAAVEPLRTSGRPR